MSVRERPRIKTRASFELRNFIRAEMKSREMTIRGFSEFVGVSHPTLLRALRGQEPTLDFLKKLASATNTDIRNLVVLAVPDAFVVDEASATARIMVEKMRHISPDARRIIENILFNEVDNIEESGDDE